MDRLALPTLLSSEGQSEESDSEPTLRRAKDVEPLLAEDLAGVDRLDLRLGDGLSLIHI